MTITAVVATALSLTACAENSLLGSNAPATTAALPPKPAIDPACATLAAQIDEMRRDGVVERAEAAAKGKSKTVSVKRESLGKLAQLEKVNAEFQAKCSTMPRAIGAQAAAQPAANKAVETAAAATKAKAAATTAKAVNSATQ
ncbi:MAG: hypothetical protein R3D67_12530 [Hyphomicrobiaceae bacterium]